MFEIHNEYVVADSDNRIGGYFQVRYEPTDHAFKRVWGDIYIIGGLDEVSFRQSRNDNLLIDSDRVLAGRVWDRTIFMLWDSDPGEHYLHVHYEVLRGYDPFKPNWRKEGF